MKRGYVREKRAPYWVLKGKICAVDLGVVFVGFGLGVSLNFKIVKNH